MEKYGLTYPQKNIWLTEKFNDNNAVNNIVCSVEINEKFDEKLCNEAINYTILKNDALRFKIIEENADAYQVVEPFEKSTFKVVDFSNKSKSEVTKYKEKFAKEAIDPKEKLCKFEILKYSQNSGAIIMKIHHLISDAWSCSKIGSMLIEYIDKKSKNEEIDDTTPSPSYIEYIKSEEEYTSSEKYKKDEEFWNEYLKDIKESVALKASTNISDKKAKRYSITLTKKESEKINKYCKENKISPYVLFLTALSTYMYRITEHDDFIIGTPVLNRANFKEKNMIGMFVSTIPLRVKVEEGTKFIDLAKSISTNTFSMFRHQKYPYSKILENIHKNTDIKNNLYNVVLSYQNARADIVDNNLYETKWIFSGSVSDQLQIHLLDMNSTGLFNINYDYIESLFSSIEMKYIHTRLMAIIFDAIENDNVDVENIRIMSKEEEHKILYEFNDTERDYPKLTNVIEIFEKNLERDPDNIALIFENKSYTYLDLEKATNRLASVLKENYNISIGDKVALIMSRSVEMIEIILAIMKLGASYLPIDPNFPKDRIKFIIYDSSPKNIISNIKLDDEINKLCENIVDYNELIKTGTKKIKRIEHVDIYKTNAYIIYTSGTTGNPKGTMISHANLINFIYAFSEKEKLNDINTAISLAKYSFDMFIIDCIVPLFLGIKIVFANEEESIMPDKAIELINKYNVELLTITPSKLNMFLEYNEKFKPDELKKLKIVTMGGEVFSKIAFKKIKKLNQNVRFFNAYGPTEITVASSVGEVNKIKNNVTIGKPLANVKIYIVDKKKRILPICCLGEQLISGKGVCNGYLNNNFLTAEKFIKYNKNGLKSYLSRRYSLF